MNSLDKWGDASELYLRSSWHSNEEALSKMVEYAGFSGGRLLDIGTGAGHAALAFAPHVAHVVATDTSPGMLETTKKAADSREIQNLEVEIADAMQLPFEEQSFDWVVCRVAAHHFSDPLKFLEGCHRVLKRDGEMLLIDTTGTEKTKADDLLDELERKRDPSHVRNYSTFAWMNMIDKVGFSIRKVATQPKPLNMKEWLDRTQVMEPIRTELRKLVTESEGEFRRYLKPMGEGDQLIFHLNETTFLLRK